MNLLDACLGWISLTPVPCRFARSLVPRGAPEIFFGPSFAGVLEATFLEASIVLLAFYGSAAPLPLLQLPFYSPPPSPMY